MRINEIRIQNFKGFKELTETFDPNFTVFVGENGSGKTSVLEAVGVSLHQWIAGMGIYPSFDLGNIRVTSQIVGSAPVFRQQLPIYLLSSGEIDGREIIWSYDYSGDDHPDAFDYSGGLFDEASNMRSTDSDTAFQTWPVIAYYSTERGLDTEQDLDFWHILSEKPMRTHAYEVWKTRVDLLSNFSNWIRRQELIAFQEGVELPIFRSVKNAVLSCLPGSKELRFSAKHGEPIILWNDGTAVTFGNLSHGQKSILAMVGDIARRCAMVNPHLETDAPAKTPGIVLIDELDLHLHPRWQRRIVDDLKRTFPEIQFITTTHSPFIIQALEPGELRVLGGEEPKIEYANRGIEEIARFIQGVDMPETSERFAKQKEAAKAYFQMLRDGRDEDDPELVAAKSKLTRLTDSYADNPGLSAIIEMEEEAALPSVLVREDPKPYAAG